MPGKRAWIDEEAVVAGRRHAAHRRRWVEKLLHRAAALPLPERRLIEQVYRHGQSITHLAQAAGVSRACLSRRLARALRCVRHPMFDFVLRDPNAIPEPLRPVARLRYVEGRSLRQTARLTHRSLHAVRRDAATLMTLCLILQTSEP